MIIGVPDSSRLSLPPAGSWQLYERSAWSSCLPALSLYAIIRNLYGCGCPYSPIRAAAWRTPVGRWWWKRLGERKYGCNLGRRVFFARILVLSQHKLNWERGSMLILFSSYFLQHTPFRYISACSVSLERGSASQ